MTPGTGSPEIAAAIVRCDFDDVIARVRSAFDDSHTAALADPTIREWLGRRYRNIFLTEASRDSNALRAAKVQFPTKLIDRRSGRELLAHRFLNHGDRDQALTQLPDAAEPTAISQTILFLPGLMNGLLPAGAFQSVWPRIEDRFGCRVLVADVHPARSSEANAADITASMDHGLGLDGSADVVSVADAQAPGDVVAIGYSKGADDFLTFLTLFPDQAKRVKAFIGWAGAFGGSYIADEAYPKIADTPAPNYPLSGQISKALRQIVPVVQPERITARLDEYDVEAAVADLTTDVREAFLAENLPGLLAMEIPTFTVEGVTSLREVPYYQAMGVLQLNNYNKNNDMFITVDQARLPATIATVLSTFRANHWDLAYDPFPWYTAMGSLNVDHKFARYPAMAAMLLLLFEIGLITE